MPHCAVALLNITREREKKNNRVKRTKNGNDYSTLAASGDGGNGNDKRETKLCRETAAVAAPTNRKKNLQTHPYISITYLCFICSLF